MTKKLEFHIIELPKILEVSNENDMLLDWLLFLDDPKCERVMKKMEENKELKQANAKLETLSQDEKMQRLAELREKAIFEHNTAVNSGFRQGMKRGMEEGLEKGLKKGIERGEYNKSKEIAIELIKNNIPLEIVYKTTKLSKKEIEKMKQELNIE